MEFADYRKEAIRYWERRRIIWTLILVPPSVVAYLFASGLALGIGSPGAPGAFGYPMVAALFCLAAFGANICYSFVYAIEFWMAGRDAEDDYRANGRRILFFLGCLLGIGLAFAGGQRIAILQYPIA